MSATNKADQKRLDLEDILALMIRVEDHCRVAMLKLSQWARTDEEGDILMEVSRARIEINDAIRYLAVYHRNYSPTGHGSKQIIE